MYVIIDLLGDEETVVVGDPSIKEQKDAHEQLVKWEDLVPEPALQILET